MFHNIYQMCRQSSIAFQLDPFYRSSLEVLEMMLPQVVVNFHQHLWLRLRPHISRTQENPNYKQTFEFRCG